MSNVNNDRLILVPCDFSPLAYHAVGHGAFLSKPMNCRLLIMHVTHRKEDISLMEKKLNNVAEECLKDFGVRPDVAVRLCSQPYSAIKDAANELNPMLVVLKTGGGVYTVKILSGTSTPFLVIQGPPRSETLHHISFPINFLNQHDEKMKRLVLFSDYFPAAVMHIITPSGKGTLKERVIASNLDLMTKVLDEQKINANFITHEQKTNTAKSIIGLSKGTDLIVIQMEKTLPLYKFFFGLREEKLIVNADKIPVLCFNNDNDFI